MVARARREASRRRAEIATNRFPVPRAVLALLQLTAYMQELQGPIGSVLRRCLPRSTGHAHSLDRPAVVDRGIRPSVLIERWRKTRIRHGWCGSWSLPARLGHRHPGAAPSINWRGNGMRRSSTENVPGASGNLGAATFSAPRRTVHTLMLCPPAGADWRPTSFLFRDMSYVLGALGRGLVAHHRSYVL